jgi:hypothetical protein
VPTLPADRFYLAGDHPPAQGDILLASVVRVVGDDALGPPRWKVLDELVVELAPRTDSLPSILVAGGRSLVMVTTHDCGQDKEFNAEVDRLLKERGVHDRDTKGIHKITSEVESDSTLDRSLQVSPLLDPASVEVAGQPVDQGLLLSGRMIGYLPVPALVVGDRQIIPPAVVDLNYRVTIDRLSYASRLSAVSEEAREELRYALARLDVLRTPTLESELSRAIGQEIRGARVDKRNPLIVKITLADGSALELLQKPGSPDPGPVSRSSRSVRK